MAHELSGATDAALDDYEEVAASGGPNGAYAELWKCLLLKEIGRHAADDEILAARGPTDGDGAWVDRLFELFIGQRTPEDLLAVAATEDEQAEAHYYIARIALLDGRPGDAREALTQCVVLERSAVMETDFARALLKQLEKDPTSASPPRVGQ